MKMVDVNVFEKIVKEYFEFQGYFLRENISYGRNNEIDLLGFNPINNEQIHVEVTERVLSENEIKALIEKKFNNKYIPNEYQRFLGSKNVKRIYVLWWYRKGSKKWHNRKVIEDKHNIKLISFEEIFEFFEDKLKDSWEEKNKVYSAIKMFMHYQQYTPKEN